MIYIEVYAKKNSYVFGVQDLSLKEVIVSVASFMQDRVIAYDTINNNLIEIKLVNGCIIVEYLLDLFDIKREAIKYFTKI